MRNNDLYDEITKAHYILLVTDKSLQTGSITCALALSNYFYENKIKHKVFNESSILPRKLNFLSKFDKISKDIPKYFDLVIYFNCTDTYINGMEFSNEVKTIFIDSSKESISEVLYTFFKINKLKISKNTAECLYAGIYTQTIGFTTPRTDSKIFTMVSELLTSNINVSDITNNLLQRESLAKFKILPKIMNTLELFKEGKVATVYLDDTWINETGAEISECDEIIDTVLNIGIVKVAVYFRLVKNEVNVSLRSKDPIDLYLFAKSFKGRGDKNSVEFMVSSSNIIKVKEEVVKSILDYI